MRKKKKRVHYNICSVYFWVIYSIECQHIFLLDLNSVEIPEYS